MQESAHVNIWKNRLAEMNLPVGPWLQELKRAVSENQPDDYAIETPDGQEMPLERLRHVVTITPGQKIAYVTDVADTASNRKAIIDLAKGADILFIEAAFADADTSLARDRARFTSRRGMRATSSACSMRLLRYLGRDRPRGRLSCQAAQSAI
jgi:ribonuclease Z